MTAEQMKALKATMPWTDQSIIAGKRTIIQIVDNAGKEVPLFTMIDFVKHTTAHLARQVEKG